MLQAAPALMLETTFRYLLQLLSWQMMKARVLKLLAKHCLRPFRLSLHFNIEC